MHMSFSKMHSPGFLANFMARKFAAALQHEMQGLGMAPAQFMVLAEMLDGDGLTQRQLVERLEVEQATMANTLARMERDGLIERRDSPEDRRARQVFVTPRGEKLRDQALEMAMRVNARAVSGLSEHETGLFMELMKKVITAPKRP